MNRKVEHKQKLQKFAYDNHVLNQFSWKGKKCMPVNSDMTSLGGWKDIKFTGLRSSKIQLRDG